MICFTSSLPVLELHVNGVTKSLVLHIRLLSLKAVLLCLSAHHCFLLLRAIRRYECTTVCSPILLLIDVWIISSFGLLYEGSCSEHSISSVSTFCGQQPPCPQERNSWLHTGWAMFNFIRKCHMIFQLVLFLICHFINVIVQLRFYPQASVTKSQIISCLSVSSWPVLQIPFQLRKN